MKKLTDSSDAAAKEVKAQSKAKADKAKKVAKVKKQRLEASNRRRRTLTRTRTVRYGLRNFSRNMWLTVAATVVMTITLLIIFATVVASSLLNETIKDQRQKMDISIYFKAETSDDTLRNLAGKLRVISNVTSVDVSNSQQEYEKAVDANKHDQAYMEALTLAASSGDGMQLPAVIHVKLDDTQNRAAVDDLVANDALFQEWIDQARATSDDAQIRQNTLNRLADIMNVAQRIGFGAAALFVVISILIIFNTIRMAIFSRREEINMMKAIGADQHFIRGPFLVEAELYGVIAALVASALGYLALTQFLPSLGRYIEVGQTQDFMVQWFWLVLLAMIAIGLVIGSISARLAVRRYLKP